MAVVPVDPPLADVELMAALDTAREGFRIDLPGGAFVAGLCPLRTVTGSRDQPALAGWDAQAGLEPAPAWAGVLSYELGALLDSRPGGIPRPDPFPLWHLGFYPALLYGAPEGPQMLASADGPAAARAAIRDWRRRARTRLEPPPPLTVVGDSWPEPGFLEGVREVQAAVRRGDVYLVNLARMLHLAGPPADAARFLALRRALHPSRGAFYKAPEWAVVSASPELFLERTPEGTVRTLPIKGTRPRGADPVSDRVLAGELLASAKDRAELIMVVDLERNDLNRAAEPGSVAMTRAPYLETLPYVHHLVAEVAARYSRPDPVPLFRALFPGGSVTGAPKSSALALIAGLEPEARGIYTGSVGFAAADGRWHWNVAIRTLTRYGDRYRLGTGAGITADSDPEAEWRETEAKAAGLLRVLGHGGG